MFKLKKCTDLRKILAHVEFDGSNMPPESWVKTAEGYKSQLD